MEEVQIHHVKPDELQRPQQGRKPRIQIHEQAAGSVTASVAEIFKDGRRAQTDDMREFERL